VTDAAHGAGRVRGAGAGAEAPRPPLRLVALQNMPGGGFPRFEAHLERAGCALRVVHAHGDEPLPALEACDAVIVGGSSLAAYDWEQHAFLREEAAFLRRAADAGVPLLGLCFGAQFLAHLLGGRAYRAHRPEVGAGAARLTEEGSRDPLLAGCPPALDVVQWHADTFDLPPGATLLARGDAIRHQLYRRDHVVGVQFHPEVTEAEVAGWADGGADDLAAAGKSAEQVVQECRALDGALDRFAARFLGNFLALVVRARR
jgi:GMP synthase (glutamine-hydrolysing)